MNEEELEDKNGEEVDIQEDPVKPEEEMSSSDESEATGEDMSTDMGTGEDVTDDDRLWAALAYVFTPLIPIILLLLEDKKVRPFIKAHNMQALVWGIVFYLVTSITSAFLIGLCLWPLGFLLQLYWAYQAYQGQMIEIPVLTDFTKSQGWV